MSATTIERKISHDMATGAAANLFKSAINVESYAMFSIQFFITALAGVANGVISLKVSNDGTNFKTVSSKTVMLDALGTGTYYIFVGTNEGISAVTHIQASFTPVGVTGGTITKAIFMGNLGNS